MPDSRLEDLFEIWEERLESGDPVSPEELCADCPELLPELNRYIRAIIDMDERLDTQVDAPSVMETPSLASSSTDESKTVLSYNAELSDLSFLAKGGLGAVYVAQDRKLNREVALKFIHRRLVSDSESRARFLIEAEVTGRLEHPGVIPVHGWGQNDDGRLFYAMRYIRGDTLEAAIQRFHKETGQRAGMPMHSLLTSFVSMCKTIAYAHNCGIIHRDIKPANVMIGRYGETIVVDWGLAMPVGRDERARSSGERTLIPSSGSQSGNTSGTGAGTPAYMSPEQHSEAASIGPESDIYSLGVTLYKIICGTNPFRGDHHYELKQKIIRGDFAPPREVKPKASKTLQAVCLKAMALNPKDRYASALDLADDVEHYLADEPVAAFKEPFTYKVARWVRRHRVGAISLVGAIAALLFASIGTSFWYNHLAESEKAAKVLAVELADREQTARKSAVEAQDATLQVSAQYAAPLIGNEIDRRWRILESAAKSYELRELMTTVSEEPDNREHWQPVQAWLNERFIEHGTATDASTWFADTDSGLLVAIAPLNESTQKTVNQNWSFRNYFHDRRHDFASIEEARTALGNGDAQIIRHANLSAPYFSRPLNRLKVAFTVPVLRHESDNVVRARTALGILGFSVEIGDFSVLKDGILVDLNEDMLEGAPARGLLLQHPKLEDINVDNVDHEAVIKRLDARLVERLQKFRRETVKQISSNNKAAVESLFLTDFEDPLNPGKTIHAACTPVMVRGRKDELQDIGWMVIVPEQALDNASD